MKTIKKQSQTSPNIFDIKSTYMPDYEDKPSKKSDIEKELIKNNIGHIAIKTKSKKCGNKTFIIKWGIKW